MCRPCSAASSRRPATSRPAQAFAGIPSKLAYEAKETRRFVKRHGITEYAMNPHFPVNTLQIMRGAVAAQQLGVFEAYVDAVYPGDVGRRAEDGRPGGDQAGVRGRRACRPIG